MNDQNNQNPFNQLSEIFIDNQRTFNIKCNQLLQRTTSFIDKLNVVKSQLNEDPFHADLNLFLNIEEESKLILYVAKELEYQRDKISNTIDLLKSSNKTKLNKT